MKALLNWLLPLLAMAGTVVAVYLVWFERHLSTARTDGELLLFVGGCYVVADAFLLGYTRRWTLRELGQVTTYAADAALYTGLGSAGLGWRWLSADGLNAVRSGFAVGGAALVIGLVWYAWESRRTETPPTAPADEMATYG